jgi:FixJ family two-component response regulator
MNPAPLNLYIVDDDEAVRRSLGMLMLSRGYAVQIFESGEAFLTSAYQHHDGCVILDLRMDGMSGLEVHDVLRSRKSNLVVLFLSGHGDIPAAVKAVQNGAFGWLEKPCSDDVLLDNIKQAFLQAVLISKQKVAQREADSLWQKLTPREREVARLVAEGKTSKIIARELASIDSRTVDTHRAHAFSKLGLSNSNELDRFLRKYNL